MYLKIVSPKGPIPDPCRQEFTMFTDDEIINLRSRYKDFEKVIFALSHNPISPERYRYTAAALVLAFRRATENEDKDILYCPWIFEAFNTMSERLLSPTDIIPENTTREQWIKDRDKIAHDMLLDAAHVINALVLFVVKLFPTKAKDESSLVKAIRHYFHKFFNLDIFNDKDKLSLALIEILLAKDCHDKLYCSEKTFKALMAACHTTGWPLCTEINDDAPEILDKDDEETYNAIIQAQLEIFAPPDTPVSDEDLIDKKQELKECLDAEHQNSNTQKRPLPGLVGAIWKITHGALDIAQKALRYKAYYQEKSLDRPTLPISTGFDPSNPQGLCYNLLEFANYHKEYIRELQSYDLSSTNSTNKLNEIHLAANYCERSLCLLSFFLYQITCDPIIEAACRSLGVFRWAIINIASLLEPNDFISQNLNEELNDAKNNFENAYIFLNELEANIMEKYKSPTQRPLSGHKIAYGQSMRELGACDFISMISNIMNVAEDFYFSLGDNLENWPRQYLPEAFCYELCWAIDASERLKEAFKGNNLPNLGGKPNLDIILHPTKGTILPVFEKIILGFPSLNQDEYLEPLFEHMYGMGIMSHFYFGLSITESEGIRILSEYLDFWREDFEQLFCSHETKIKPLTTIEQAQRACSKLAGLLNRLSKEYSIQYMRLERINVSKPSTDQINHDEKNIHIIAHEVAKEVKSELNLTKQYYSPIPQGPYAAKILDECDRNQQIVQIKKVGTFFISSGNNIAWEVIAALASTNDPHGFANLTSFPDWQKSFSGGKDAKIPGYFAQDTMNSKALYQYIEAEGKSGRFRFATTRKSSENGPNFTMNSY